jgi:hypothetical protein
MYWQLAQLRQRMNDVEHVEPTGAETFGTERVPVGRLPIHTGIKPTRVG